MNAKAQNIAGMTLRELRVLKSKIDREISKRDESARKGLLKQMEKLAAQNGMSLAEVLGAKPAVEGRAKAEPKSQKRVAGKVKAKKPVAPKYRNPDDSSMTWSGRGRKPLWIEKAIADGKALDDLLIAS